MLASKIENYRQFRIRPHKSAKISYHCDVENQYN